MEAVKIEDILEYKFLSALTPSPNKEKCAFVVSQCHMEGNDYRSFIYVLDRKTRQVKCMTSGGQENALLWLNDSTLLFSGLRDPQLKKRVGLGEPWTCYYALPLDGGEASEYMRIPKKVSAIERIDEDRFAIVADLDLDNPDPHSLPAEERDIYLRERKARLESYLAADEMPFRQNGLGFRNGLRSALFIFDRRTGQSKQITRDEQNVDIFSVSGERIIFSPKTFTKAEPKIFQGGISVYDIRTGQLHAYVAETPYRMRFCGFMNGEPIFMGSDGARHYYQENPYFFYIDETDGKVHIFARNDNSAENAILTDVRLGSSSHIQIDGNYIYYTRTMGNHGPLMRVDRQGRFEQLTFKGSVDGIAVCGDEIIMIAMRGNRLQEIYALKDGREEQLTAFNEWVQQERSLSTPEEIQFPNEEGTLLDGCVLEPVGHRPGEKAPCILYIHGGHKCAFGTGYYHEMQVWANRGYYVIFCNPRGSDGRDNDFFEIMGQYGYKDFSDLMAFTDACIERYPDIDPERMGVGGGSYGGFMTNWVIGHTSRFRCACSQRGISNWVSDFGCSDTGYQMPMYQFDSDIWDNLQAYLDHSPLIFADKCTTPTLFIHAEEDYRCPLSEGIQMYSALKYNGVPARLCIFKGENHELSRNGKPVNRINRIKEITGWFDKYLQK